MFLNNNPDPVNDKFRPEFKLSSTQPHLNSSPTQLYPNLTQPNSTQPQLNLTQTQLYFNSTQTKFQLDLISTSISTSTSIQPNFNLKLRSTSASLSTQPHHGYDMYVMLCNE